MNMKKLIFSAAALWMAISCAGAETFTLNDGKNGFTADFNGKALIVNEGFTPGWNIARRSNEKQGNDLILNAWGKSKDFFNWRREVSTRKNGSELEISFQVPVYAFNDEIFQFLELPAIASFNPN